MRQAFSLVELSIVLVILGLLTGGILAGQSLIRAAELRSVTTDMQKYSTALMSFRDKYFALPGDMTNAQSFWGVAHATPATCATTSSSTPLTCNGDGNGQISFATGANEIFRAWQHLANAGLIEGSYTGIEGSTGAGYHVVPGTNAPRIKLSNGGVGIMHLGTIASDANNFDGTYGNIFVYGAAHPSQMPGNPLFKPEEAWNIDTKIDDGKPAFGNVLTYKHVTTCYDDTNNYNYDDTAIRCALIFKSGT
ncbi:MAG: hypothetical protein C0436_03320 [Alphaproteobacteria bacterium]|nr:hypothetical protein [Alphaproteobacteria bacterium]